MNIKQTMQKLMRVFTAVAALGLIAIPAAAQYPAKPIRIVVPFAAGGAADAMTRIVAQPLSETLGQPVVVENKSGAGGAIAGEAQRREGCRCEPIQPSSVGASN